MDIHVYTFCYNEEFIIPYFLRHYGQFASKIVVFDNESTDKSVMLLRAHPSVFVRTYKTGDELRTDIKTHITNSEWKRSKGLADYVIVCDIDELLYHPDLAHMFMNMKTKGMTVARPYGYDMITEKKPETSGQIYDEVKFGVRNPEWDKMILFDPNLVEEINYEPGAHWAQPEGRVQMIDDPDLKLLHFRYLGIEYILEKHHARASRVSQVNRGNNWSHHYFESKDSQIEKFNSALLKRKKIL